MPGWLKTLFHLNPLTRVLDTMRTFMLADSTSAFGPSYDYAVILLTADYLDFI
jgi:ABC-type polysaccharide/polyol phosphate export permease